MKRFEHRIVRAKLKMRSGGWVVEATDEPLDDALTRLGGEGWEAVGITAELSGTHLFVLLKREVAGDAEE